MSARIIIVKKSTKFQLHILLYRFYLFLILFQAERAHALAQEAKENGVPLSTSVYNALLSCVGFLKEGAALRIEALKGLLAEMNEQVKILFSSRFIMRIVEVGSRYVEPNIKTLHS